MDFFRRMFNNTEDDSQPPAKDDSSIVTSETPENTELEDEMAEETRPFAEIETPQDQMIPGSEPADMSMPETTDAAEPSNGEVAAEDHRITAPVDFVPEGVTRPLPAEPTMQSLNGHVIYGQASDQGMVRSNNQDTAVSFFFKSDSVEDRPDFGVFVIADGMGGHHDGEKASAITGRVVISEVVDTIYVPMLRGEDLNSTDRPTIQEALYEAVQKANKLVRRDVPEGGTTLTAIVIIANLGHVAHVGDSRAYLISAENGVEQITRDHSLVARLEELGQITQEEAAQHEQRNVLYRAIGQSEELEVDTLTRRLPAASHVLICSDGLWGLVTDQDITDIIEASSDPQQACEKLVALANTRGGTDNISVILIKVPAN